MTQEQNNLNKVIKGDCLEVLKTLPQNSVDSIVTDPPYELGFMGKSWDKTGIANNVELWKECLRVLKPGGHLLAFSGTRTYHRMASAIEDAGFEVRDMIEWVYGSGFPKSLNIGKAIDKMEGTEYPKNTLISENGSMSGGNYTRHTREIESEAAKQWEGWGTALKPAHEPICMARKPLVEKTVAENCLKYGTGGINIDESRVGTEEDNRRPSKGGENGLNGTSTFKIRERKVEDQIKQTGRFPANLIHDNSEEVRECFPDESERFFKSIIYQAKASKSERNRGCEELEGGVLVRQGLAGEHKNPSHKNNHPTVKPIALMEYLIKMVTPKAGLVLDPFTGSGSTLVAAKQNGYQFIGIEMMEEYISIINARLNN